MKVVGFNGSPRPKGNTSILIKTIFGELESRGIECEMVQIGGKLIHGCTACGACKKNQDKRCSVTDDMINGCIEKILEADGIIIGSPTYFAGMTSETKAFIDRVGYVARANNYMYRRKIGIAVTAVRRAGAINVFNGINQLYLANGMIVPGSTYWGIGIGRDPGDVSADEEGMTCMREFGSQMAWLLEKTRA